MAITCMVLNNPFILVIVIDGERDRSMKYIYASLISLQSNFALGALIFSVRNLRFNT